MGLRIYQEIEDTQTHLLFKCLFKKKKRSRKKGETTSNELVWQHQESTCPTSKQLKNYDGKLLIPQIV